MILKAGTYRFNDVLNTDIVFEQAINFYYDETFEGMNIRTNFSSLKIELGALVGYQTTLIIGGETYDNYSDKVIYSYDGGFGGRPQEHTITEDTEVDDTFGTWYIASTNYNEVNKSSLVTIEYNGSTIAELNAGETATLSCEGKKMVSDVVVKVGEVKKEETDSIVGTWVIKKDFALPETKVKYTNIPFQFYAQSETGGTTPTLRGGYSIYLWTTLNTIQIKDHASGDGCITQLYPIGVNEDEITSTSSLFINGIGAGDPIENSDLLYTIIITAHPEDTTFITWLKANGTKQ